eukprot:Gregarina_sp_Pseudo_9__5971@NODE_977_length_2011_cov_26_167850_g915_i0_p1_GENE_NODE_977_length_2011_cov_26_167850_g915_i0NODE_977_length_2011_cov_26_167850_g915_i0_p1_ORF_typecomplete_len597_score121_36MFS_1/PF07690_16/7_8e15Nodulinlike/PF06813_13/5_9e15Nodulinlike/PF06813_13/3_7e02MFS_4/PF06779_14/1_4MFS_4/PF06779_14/5_2MFS_4/PF06779_14/9_8e06_NODE_977_length_2011_cov_26_167850_g915_i02351791
MAAALCSGLIYIFGILSEILHKSGFTPSQIDLIFGLGTFGQYFGLLPGFMADRIGVTVTMGYGLLCTTVGYGLILPLLANSVCSLPSASEGVVELMDLVVSRAFLYSEYSIPPPCQSGGVLPRSQITAILLGLSIFFIAQGGVAIHYSTLPVLLKKCVACKRGLVSGTLAAGYGGSAILLSALYGTAFHGAPSGRPFILAFLFFVGSAMTVVTCLIIVRFLVLPEAPVEPEYCLREHTPKQSPTPVMRTMPSLVEEDETLPKRRAVASVFSFELDRGESEHERSKLHSGTDDPLDSFSALALSGRFAMYLLATAFMQGTCAATMGNISMLREAYDYDSFRESSAIPRQTSRLWSLTKMVRLLSIGNFSGRIVSALVSQYVHTAKYHRFFILAGILIASGQFVMLTFPFSQGLFLLSLFLTACCLGMNFAIGPVWVMQNLSVNHFASLQAVVMCGVAAATFGLSLITGSIYEAEALKQVGQGPSTEEHLLCRGPSCFRFVHILEFLINVVSIGLVFGAK